jgi:hypothetical protein
MAITSEEAPRFRESFLSNYSHSNFTQNSPLTPIQSGMDSLVSTSMEKMMDGYFFAGLLFGRGANPFIRNRALSLSGSLTNVVPRILAPIFPAGARGLALASEAMIFESSTRVMKVATGSANLSSLHLYGIEGVGNGVIYSALSLYALQWAGVLSVNQNWVVQNLLQGATLMLSHQVSGLLEITDKSRKTLGAQFAEVEGLIIHFWAGMNVWNQLSPRLIQSGCVKHLSIEAKEIGSRKIIERVPAMSTIEGSVTSPSGTSFAMMAGEAPSVYKSFRLEEGKKLKSENTTFKTRLSEQKKSEELLRRRMDLQTEKEILEAEIANKARKQDILDFAEAQEKLKQANQSKQKPKALGNSKPKSSLTLELKSEFLNWIRPFNLYRKRQIQMQYERGFSLQVTIDPEANEVIVRVHKKGIKKHLVALVADSKGELKGLFPLSSAEVRFSSELLAVLFSEAPTFFMRDGLQRALRLPEITPEVQVLAKKALAEMNEEFFAEKSVVPRPLVEKFETPIVFEDWTFPQLSGKNGTSPNPLPLPLINQESEMQNGLSAVGK